MQTGSEPLEKKREKFARLQAEGKSQREAYQAVNPDSSDATADVKGCVWAADDKVKVRTAWLKKQAVEQARKSASKWVKTKGEWLAWLSEGAQTPIGDIDERSPFCVAAKYQVSGGIRGKLRQGQYPEGNEESTPETTTVEIKKINPIDCVKIIGQWEGHEKTAAVEIGDIVIRIGK